VLIVGAGIVGLACAEALAVRGAAVRIVEAKAPAGVATAAGMGHILVLDDSEAQLALTRRSRALWDARAADWSSATEPNKRGVPERKVPHTTRGGAPRVVCGTFRVDVEREVCGTLWVAANEVELEIARAKHEWFGARDVATEVLDAATLARFEPHLRAGLAGALYVPGDSVVYPPGAAAVLWRRAAAHGATLRAGSPVVSIGDGWIQGADGARLEADVVIVAAGLASVSLLQRELCPPGLALIPKKGHLVITDRAPGFVRHQLVELGYLASAHGHERTSVAFNAQPRATGQVLLGSSRQIGASDTRVERDVVARMVQRGLEFLPGLAQLSVVRTWVGVRPATADNLPLLGPLPAAPRTWLATGHEGVGITTSLGSAELIADLLVAQRAGADAPREAIRSDEALSPLEQRTGSSESLAGSSLQALDPSWYAPARFQEPAVVRG